MFNPNLDLKHFLRYPTDVCEKDEKIPLPRGKHFKYPRIKIHTGTLYTFSF